MTEQERDRNLDQYQKVEADQAEGVPDAITCAECPLDVPCMTVTGGEPLPDGGVMVRACPIIAATMNQPDGRRLIEELRRMARGEHVAR